MTEEFTASPKRPDEDRDDAVEYDLWSSVILELLGSMMPIGEKMSSKGAIIRSCRERRENVYASARQNKQKQYDYITQCE